MLHMQQTERINWEPDKWSLKGQLTYCKQLELVEYAMDTLVSYGWMEVWTLNIVDWTTSSKQVRNKFETIPNNSEQFLGLKQQVDWLLNWAMLASIICLTIQSIKWRFWTQNMRLIHVR